VYDENTVVRLTHPDNSYEDVAVKDIANQTIKDEIIAILTSQSVVVSGKIVKKLSN
jgi:hypothetical protein